MLIEEYNEGHRVVQLRSGPATVAEFGDGAPALFVHGVFLSGALWRNVIANVRDLRRCIAVDLPAHGGTPTISDLSLNGLVAWLGELCDQMDLGPVDLVANDTGGAIAQVLAARRPALIRTLTLTNCDANDNLPPAEFVPTVEMAARGELAPGLTGLAQDLDACRSVLLEAGYERPSEVLDEVVLAYLGPLLADANRGRDIERFITSLEAGPLADSTQALRDLQAPTLIAWGCADRFFDRKWAHWLGELIPGTKSVIEFEEAKLWFPDERADEFATHLRAFWTEWSDGALVKGATG